MAQLAYLHGVPGADDEDIVGLDIAMQDSLPVRLVERAGELREDV